MGVEVHIENASKYGLSFNNSPTTKPSDMIFTGVDWGSGTLNVDSFVEVLSQTVSQDGNEYSVRSKYDPDDGWWYALRDFTYKLNGDVVLDLGALPDIYDDFLDSSETTGIKLTGDQLLRLLLTGNDSKIFEAIFVGGDWFTGSNGNDVIYGYGDDDTIYGKGGNDLISGGPGRDTLLGDDGNDTITGGDGHDDISGGSGNDKASCSSAGGTWITRQS